MLTARDVTFELEGSCRADLASVSASLCAVNRRYAVLIICILAALLTPTPDVVNMMLMGGPLYLLYEVGILILKVMKI